jgi:hypothetical protein
LLQWVEDNVSERRGTVERGPPSEQQWVEVGSVGLGRKFAEAKERWRATRSGRREEVRDEEAGGFHL